jgi:hypothetical protein
MVNEDGMVIFLKVEELLLWLLPKADSFPKLYRQTLTKRAMDSSLDLLEHLSHANKHRNAERLKALTRADVCLLNLRIYIRLTFKWQWLNMGQYEHAARLMEEIGKLLGAWQKQTQRSIQERRGTPEP